MKSLKQLLPPIWVTLLLLVVPIGLTTYFVVTQYSNKFLVEQNVDYYQVNNSVVRSLLFDNKLADFLTRFSDFVFWGLLAAVILLVAWFIGVAKVTARNHAAVQSFTNFQADGSWQRHFVIELIVKLILGVAIVMLTIVLYATLTPKLLGAVGDLLSSANGAVIHLLLANIYMYIGLFMLVISCRAFKRIQLN